MPDVFFHHCLMPSVNLVIFREGLQPWVLPFEICGTEMLDSLLVCSPISCFSIFTLFVLILYNRGFSTWNVRSGHCWRIGFILQAQGLQVLPRNLPRDLSRDLPRDFFNRGIRPCSVRLWKSELWISRGACCCSYSFVVWKAINFLPAPV